MNKIPVGISACLLGQKVRYDGEHSKNTYITEILSQYFEWVPFCPEIASGMGVPRPPVQLRMTNLGIRCVDVKDHNLDVTQQLTECSSMQNQWLKGLCGYIFKKGSPSCGMKGVKVYKKEYPERIGTGLFAQHIKDSLPILPLEEEGRLEDPELRENFIQRVFVMARWKLLNRSTLTLNKLSEFYAQHQLIILSHDQNGVHELNNLIDSATQEDLEQVANSFVLALMKSLKKIATRDNHLHVLKHIQSSLTTHLDASDISELTQTIDHYHLGFLPLLAPITLLKHHFRKHPDPFIKGSLYMTPSLEELAINTVSH